MQTLNDDIEESKRIVLGLNPEGFRRFLVMQGKVTELELAAHPERVSELMEIPSIWQEFEECMVEQYMNEREDERFKWRD